MKENNRWKKELENSAVFFSIIGDNYFDDPLCLEQFIYAKNLKKPMILLIKEHVNLNAIDLIKQANIKLQIRVKEKLSKEQEILLKKTMEEFINGCKKNHK